MTLFMSRFDKENHNHDVYAVVSLNHHNRLVIELDPIDEALITSIGSIRFDYPDAIARPIKIEVYETRDFGEFFNKSA